MNKLIFILVLSSSQIFAAHTLSLDLRSGQYKELLDKALDLEDDYDQEKIIQTGSRLLNWIKAINDSRADNKIELYKPEDSR